MNFKSEFNTLVISGNWNNSIFSPEWVSRFLLPKQQLNVEIPLNTFGSFRISTQDLRIFTLNNKLNFSILSQTDGTFHRIGELAIKTADLLLHTPVNGLGLNFAYECKSSDPLDEIFLLKDTEKIEQLGHNVNSIQIRRSLIKGEYTLNFTINKLKEIYIFDFNYHIALKSLTDFKEKFDAEKMLFFKNDSLKLLLELYNLELE